MVVDRSLGAEILGAAIERHGGLERWRRVRAIELQLESLGGAVPRGKGLGRTFTAPRVIRVEPRRARVVWRAWPGRELCGVYEGGRVAILPEADLSDTAAPKIAGDSHRHQLQGLRRLRRWRDLDALYFFGYALVHYLSLPFSLRDAELLSARRLAKGGGELWVRLPKGHTHTAVEGFYFDRSGLLVRHDYRADVISRAACGAHRSSDYLALEGLPIARERTVFAKLGHRPPSLVTPIAVLRASLTPVAVELDAPSR